LPAPATQFPSALAPTLLLGCLFALLLAIAIIDARHGIIPDWANFALAMGGLMRSGLGSGPAFHEAAIAAIVVSVGMLTFREVFARVRGCAGLGMGDIKFLAAAALWTG
jgi:leader peptidase (prepilin peptidase) / N-methyltransferase